MTMLGRGSPPDCSVGGARCPVVPVPWDGRASIPRCHAACASLSAGGAAGLLRNGPATPYQACLLLGVVSEPIAAHSVEDAD